MGSSERHGASRQLAVVVGQAFRSIDPERAVLAPAGIEVLDARALPPREALDRAAGADAVLSDTFRWDADALSQLTRCRVIAQYGVGVDTIDVGEASRRGITVTNVPGYCADELADHALGLMLAVKRRILAQHHRVVGGQWDFQAAGRISRIRGQVAGIVGFGRAGRAFAARVRALGMHVLAHDPFQADVGEHEAEPAMLGRLLTESDVVSLHLPLTDDTRRLIDVGTLARMKPSAVLVNTARGELVDQGALARALESGRLAGAGLDVLAHEPPNADDPLLSLDTVVVTPHMGFYSEQAIHEVQVRAAEEVLAVLRGDSARHPVAVGRL
jgi:D-3-phosphoglycerate dehydrogenase